MLARIPLSVSVILTTYFLAVGRRWVAGVLKGGAAPRTMFTRARSRATALVDLGVQEVVLAVIVTDFVVGHWIRLPMADESLVVCDPPKNPGATRKGHTNTKKTPNCGHLGQVADSVFYLVRHINSADEAFRICASAGSIPATSKDAHGKP